MGSMSQMKSAPFTGNVQYVQYVGSLLEKNDYNWGNVQYVQSCLAHEGGGRGRLSTASESKSAPFTGNVRYVQYVGWEFQQKTLLTGEMFNMFNLFWPMKGEGGGGYLPYDTVDIPIVGIAFN
eukprot:520692-Amphidinium_carterae.1